MSLILPLNPCLNPAAISSHISSQYCSTAGTKLAKPFGTELFALVNTLVLFVVRKYLINWMFCLKLSKWKGLLCKTQTTVMLSNKYGSWIKSQRTPGLPVWQANTSKLSLTHIHRPRRWPSMKTNSITMSRWMLWANITLMNTEQWGTQVCFSNQEYHLNCNNLPDEVASSWLNDRKVRSLCWTRRKWDLGVKKGKKIGKEPHIIPLHQELHPRLNVLSVSPN